MTKQKEEVLDLIREKYEDRKDALNKIKGLLPTSRYRLIRSIRSIKSIRAGSNFVLAFG